MNEFAKAEIIRALTDAYGEKKANALAAEIGIDTRTEIAVKFLVKKFELTSSTLDTFATPGLYDGEILAAFRLADTIIQAGKVTGS